MRADMDEQYDKIYRYCYMKLKHRQAAEDVTQEAFLRFLENNTYKDIGKEISYHLTIGQVIRNQIILLIFASVLESAFAMFCAEKMKSGMGTMAVMTGILLLSLTLNIPEQFRIAVQLWNSIPSNILAVWNLLDCRLVSLFGRYFTQMQVLPIVYVILAFLLAAGGWRGYKRYQITK